MPNSTTRSPILDYWYTTAQISDVGKAWMEAAANRLFVTPEQIDADGEDLWADEVVNITGLQAFHLDRIPEYPFHIMLSLNRGNSHWTSIAISISDAPALHKKIVKLSFSDSLGSYIPSEVHEEMDRIEALFREKFGVRHVEVTQEFYAHTWSQSDMSSCGPYSLKNAARCLAGEGATVNPGREAIRREQLDVMTEATAIKFCSTNDEIDDILAHWIINRTAEGRSYEISSAVDVNAICEAFASTRGCEPAAIRQKFIDEYGLEYGLESGIPAERLMRYLPVISRMRELVNENLLIRKALSPEQREALLKPLRSENTMRKFEEIRMIIRKEHDEASSYSLTAEVIELIIQLNVDAAEKKLRAIILKSDEDLKLCLLAISEMVGSRSIETDYTLKLIGMAKNFREIAEASHACDLTLSVVPEASSPEASSPEDSDTAVLPVPADKTITGTIQQPPVALTESKVDIPSRDAQLPVPKTLQTKAKTRDLLDAQINLVRAAIRRNNASLLMHIGYLLHDFCEAIVEILSGGRWTPEFRRIQAIEKALSIPFAKERPKKEDYQEELKSLQVIRNSLTGPDEAKPLLLAN